MSEVKKPGFLSRLLPRVENLEQLHIVLSIVSVGSGICLIGLGAVLPYFGEAPETDIGNLTSLFSKKKTVSHPVLVDHSLRVMLLGLLLILVGFQKSFAETWKRIRGEKVDVTVNLEGVVTRDELKRTALKK